MHVIKGGWVGQTFALAKGNDSGGRKSRIRRSKEERKAMVESFIKKYSLYFLSLLFFPLLLSADAINLIY